MQEQKTYTNTVYSAPVTLVKCHYNQYFSSNSSSSSSSSRRGGRSSSSKSKKIPHGLLVQWI